MANRQLQKRLDALGAYYRRRKTMIAVVDIRNLSADEARQAITAKQMELLKCGVEGRLIVLDDEQPDRKET